jgi:hypothetical protein
LDGDHPAIKSAAGAILRSREKAAELTFAACAAVLVK